MQSCLERSQEIQYILFIDLIQSVEIRNDLIGLRGGYKTSARAGMGPDCDQQIFCASIVQEENPRAESPERRGSELVSSGIALANSIREIRSHVV